MSHLAPPTENPFASHRTRPGALPFRFPEGVSAELLIARLRRANLRGQIVGPHGSGKSTLLSVLINELQTQGISTRSIALHDAQRHLPADFLNHALTGQRVLLVVDGYEQLSYLSRWRLCWRCWRKGWGLLVTTHIPAAHLPILATLSPTVELMVELLDRLLARKYETVDRQHAEMSFLRHGGNLREVWFDLYDRHERTRSRKGE